MAVPALGQAGVNQASVELVNMVAAAPRPDRLHLGLEALLRSDNIFHPTIRPFDTALFLEDTMPDIKPFGHVTIPQLVSKKRVAINLETDLLIENMEQFTRYISNLVSLPEARLAMRGKPSVKLGALPAFNVDFNKVVTQRGVL